MSTDEYVANYGGPDMYNTTILPNGQQYLTRVLYTAREQPGIVMLVVTSFISLLAVLGLLVAISTSAFNTRASKNKHLFVRTHVAAYFVCLLVSDILQAIGSIMNTKWVSAMAVEIGGFCTLQGAIKQFADVGTAIWSLIIAIHTFNVLFLHIEISRFILYATLIGGWTATATFVIGGPAALDTAKNGPFFGISGYWCWISGAYPTSRITLDYLIMFLSAGFCTVLYTLVFLRLRGNIVLSGWRVRFILRPRTNTASWRGREEAAKENYTMTVARRMLLYPIAYTILILPIAACRFSAWAGHDVPFAATVFADVVFLMSGLVNVILFSTTRRILPPRTVFSWLISRPKLQESTTAAGDSEKSPEFASRDVKGKGLRESVLSRDSTLRGSLDLKPRASFDSGYGYKVGDESRFSVESGVPVLQAAPFKRIGSPDSDGATPRPEMSERDSYGMRTPQLTPSPRLVDPLELGFSPTTTSPNLQLASPDFGSSFSAMPLTPPPAARVNPGLATPLQLGARPSLAWSNTGYSAASVYDLYGARSPTDVRRDSLEKSYPGAKR